jgi:hypothetical protein
VEKEAKIHCLAKEHFWSLSKTVFLMDVLGTEELKLVG